MNLSNSKKNIHVISLGGTITCVARHRTDAFYESPSIDIQEIISIIAFDDAHITSESLFQKISHDLSQNDVIYLAKKVNDLVNNHKIDGIVIVQGTNCLEETAYFISLVIKTKKPIIFTGSFLGLAMSLALMGIETCIMHFY